MRASEITPNTFQTNLGHLVNTPHTPTHKQTYIYIYIYTHIPLYIHLCIHADI